MAKRAGRTGTGLTTGTTGAISELVVSAELMRRGYAVFRSLSPSCFCDLIAHKDGRQYRVEVRTGYRAQTGKLGFPRNTHGEIDIFGVNVPGTGEVIFLGVDGQVIDL